MLNYDFITKKAHEAKIDTVTIIREYWQLLFLQRMYLADGSEKICFKGGTAIRFLFGSFRFSEDLDFTSAEKKNRVEKLLHEVFDFFVKKTGDNLEFRKEKVWEKFEEESLKYRFLFQPKGMRQKSSIRIDVSFREKPVTFEQTTLVPFDYPITPYPLIVHLNAQELLAEKLRALFVRGKPRDLFDLWYLLTKKIIPDPKLIKKKFKIYPHLKFSKERLKEIISGYNEQELKKDLNQFLPENYREFYKKLKTAALSLLSA